MKSRPLGAIEVAVAAGFQLAAVAQADLDTRAGIA